MSEVVENESIRVETNADELARVLSGDKLLAATGEYLGALAKEVEIAAVPYPQEGPWNTPGPYPARWYQRHFGPRWALKAGGVHGRNTSEQMQKRWKTAQAGPLAWRIENAASYSAFVMGEEQQPYHAAHGWRKLSDIARSVIADKRDEILQKIVDKWVGGAT